VKGEKEQGLEDLREIRSMMERSSRFLSLSGLSGIAAGCLAILGGGVAYWALVQGWEEDALVRWIWADALIVFLGSVGISIAFSARLARRRGQVMWGAQGKSLLMEMVPPLLGGGVLSIVLVYHRMFLAIPGIMLLFYGTALASAAKVTREDARHLGWVEMGLGVLALVFLPEGLLIWMAGFGMAHIVYGVIMFRKYEQ